MTFSGRVSGCSEAQLVEQEGGAGQWGDSDHALTASNRTLPCRTKKLTVTF